MRLNRHFSGLAGFAATFFVAAGAHAQSSPLGVWIDHTGRGAVEITQCGKNLCGNVVWIQDAKNAKGCGIQILKDVKPVAGNKWDNGKIYDPDKDSSFDVELTPMGADKLKVMGYAGVKFLSQTFTWKRAPADLKKCNDTTEAAAPAPQQSGPTAAAEPAPSNGASVSAGTGSTTAKAEPPPANVPAPKAATRPSSGENVAAAPEAAAPEVAEEPAKPEPRKKSKKQCHYDVPFVDMRVMYPCDK